MTKHDKSGYITEHKCLNINQKRRTIWNGKKIKVNDFKLI